MIDDTLLIRNYRLEQRRAAGLGWFLAAIFIVGEMAGGGMVTLPKAMINASWLGLSFLFVGALTSGYTGAQLGDCWTMLQEQWPEYRSPTRKPYPEIADRAVGRWAKHLVSGCINVTLFGVCVVFLLLSAENVQYLVQKMPPEHYRFSYCYWVLILAFLLWPFTLLGTPKDQWFVALGAVGATMVACALILIGIGFDAGEENKKTMHVLPPRPQTGALSTFLSFGTFMFAYGGHAAFPTFQHDMKEPKHFNRSVILAYIIIILMYVPVAVFGYVTYGGGVGNSILENIGTPSVRIAVTILITIHMCSTFVIVTNPINQDFEEVFNMPNEIGWRRVALRSGTVLAIVFVAVTIPKFDVLLNLIGGSTVTLLTFVFPGWFYLSLYRRTRSRFVPWYELMVTIPLLVLGLIGGLASVYASIVSFAVTGITFVPPCYVSTNSTL